MKLVRMSFIVLAAAIAVLGLGAPAYAFHSGGVAECGGCRSMDTPNPAGSDLLIGAGPSGTTPASHASTIIGTPQGLVAAWFGGKQERAPDVGIWLARHDGSRWSPPERVATGRMPDGTPCPCWNPVLSQPHGGPLMLFFKAGPRETEWWGEV